MILIFIISRCPPGYIGLSCEMCSSGFERVPGGLYLGTCAGCNCNGHATACDPISGHCLVRTELHYHQFYVILHINRTTLVNMFKGKSALFY